MVLETRSNMEDLMAALARIPELDIDIALTHLSGAAHLYEQILLKSVRALPSNLSAMTLALSARDVGRFGIQAHGLKGAFNQVGALKLAKRAEALEKAAKNGDLSYCTAQYSAFREKALVFYAQINPLLEECAMAAEPQKEPGGRIADHADVLKQAKAAAAGFDSAAAVDALKPLARYCFGRRVDGLIASALGELELFRPRKALPHLMALLVTCDQQNAERQDGDGQ